VSAAAPGPAPLPEAVAENVRRLPGGGAWLAGLPGRLAALRADWAVEPGAPFDGGSCSWAGPVRTAGGAAAVLKVGYPHDEARGEAAALRFWAGDGAVRLLRSSADGFTLLLEAAVPGTPLRDAPGRPEELLAAGAGVLARLWRRPAPPGPGFDALGPVVAGWAELLRERMDRLRPPDADPYLVAAAARLLETLPGSAPRTVVLHGDANPGNVLRAEREPWLAIDPKPMAGDPAYDPAPMLLQVDPPLRHPDPEAVLRHRIGLVADVAGGPAERIAVWAFARSVEAGLEMTDRGHPDAPDMLRGARALARVAGV
jgi:streptomycin 6-kinase